jgi:DNA polymerase (family X)
MATTRRKSETAAAAAPIENIDIAKVFEEVADLLEIQSENPFRVRAYRTAARTVETLGVPCASLAKNDPKALQRHPGIAKDLAGKICEIVETGSLALLRELTAQLPESLVEMVRLPGLGPKRAKQIYDTLGIKTLDQLEEAARSGRLRELRGIGATLEQQILQGIADRKAAGGRCQLAEADAYVQPLVAYLRDTPGLIAIEVAGSYRRRCETVGDVDVLVAAKRGAKIAERFVGYPLMKQVQAKGDTKCSIVLRSGLQVDLRVVPESSFGAALHYFTGSKPHNIAIRTMGVKQHLKINEYGIFRGTRQIGGRAEEEVFRAVGLPLIAPELRENRGEIEAARTGKLPRLVEIRDIKGDLQMHTTHTDGKNTIAEMARACCDRGYTYMAITDHTKAVRVAGGLGGDAFRKQFREIDRVQRQLPQIRLLKSAEVDILDDGALDLDDTTLEELDLVVISVHSKLTMDRKAMTRRVVRALRHPHVHILGHPTGRMLGRREASTLDMEEVIKAARDHGVLLEINAQPDRLDLNDIHVRMAKEAGVKLVIDTDAHRIEELSWMRYGVDQARRGWCEAADIANTRSWEEFQKFLAK